MMATNTYYNSEINQQEYQQLYNEPQNQMSQPAEGYFPPIYQYGY